MSDPLRTDPTQTSPHRADDERDAKIESLLLAGLDHYFASDYAQAIDVWTRALFLDRNHARARAYIERARSALAEQQRESEELLHSGIAAFESGRMEAARQLLNAAVQRGGAHDVALAFLTRIDRIDAAAPAPVSSALVAAHTVPIPAIEPGRRVRTAVLLSVLAVCVAAGLAVTLMNWNQVRTLFSAFTSPIEANSTPVPAIHDPLFVPRSSDAALARARTLVTSGQLHDALRALEQVRSTDPLRADADQMKATIQRELIAHAPAPQ